MRRKVGKSPEQRAARELQATIDHYNHLMFFRGVLTTGRRHDAVDTMQLTDLVNVQCRVLQSDVDAGDADPEDVGKFWFTPGYSKVGGPDKIRP